MAITLPQITSAPGDGNGFHIRALLRLQIVLHSRKLDFKNQTRLEICTVQEPLAKLLYKITSQLCVSITDCNAPVAKSISPAWTVLLITAVKALHGLDWKNGRSKRVHKDKRGRVNHVIRLIWSRKCATSYMAAYVWFKCHATSC